MGALTAPYDEIRRLRQTNAALMVRISELGTDLIAARSENEALAKQLGRKLTYNRATEILEEVAVDHCLSVIEICSAGRTQALSAARHDFFYRCAFLTDLKLTAIGAIVGGLDHTTIIHGIHRHAFRNGLPLPRGMKPRTRDQ